jgi:hypothetical protein
MRRACSCPCPPEEAGLRWATPLLFALLWLAFVGQHPGTGAAQQRALLLTGARCPAGMLARCLAAALQDGRGAAPGDGAVPACRLGPPARQPGVPADLRAAGGTGDGAVAVPRLFLLGGAVANLAAALSIGAPDRIIIGASGAVSAVIGAYLALFPRAKLGVVLPLGLFLEFVRAPASLLIGIWALLQVVFAYIGPALGAVAWWAHLAGFAFGVRVRDAGARGDRAAPAATTRVLSGARDRHGRAPNL